MPWQLKSFSDRLWLASNVALLCLAIATPTQAQIIPDTTLPVNSTITPQGNTLTIEGEQQVAIYSTAFASFRFLRVLKLSLTMLRIFRIF